MPTDIAPSITPTYDAVVNVVNDGEVLTHASFVATAQALGDRIEFVRQVNDNSAADPTLFTTFREDFHSVDAPDQPFPPNHTGYLYADNTWLVPTMTNCSWHPGIGSAKNPGQALLITAGGANGETIMHLGARFSFATFDYFCVVLNAFENVGNTNDNISFGLGQSIAAGFAPDVAGTDSLMCHYWRNPSTTLWQQNRTVSGSTFAQNALGPYVSQSFVKIEAVKQSNGDIQFFYNGSLATTTSLAQMPSGNCYFLIKSTSINTDASVFIATIDQVVLRTKIASRLGL